MIAVKAINARYITVSRVGFCRIPLVTLLLDRVRFR